MIRHCVVNKDGKKVEGVLVGIFQKSMVVDPSPMLGGHSGGVSAGPVAVVRIGDYLEEVELIDLTLRYREDNALLNSCGIENTSKPDAIIMGEKITRGFKEGFESRPCKSGDVF